MLGSSIFGLLLDAAHPGRLCLRSQLLARRHRLLGAGHRRQHGPGVEHAEHSEPVRHPLFLAGYQVESYSGENLQPVRIQQDLLFLSGLV